MSNRVNTTVQPPNLTGAAQPTIFTLQTLQTVIAKPAVQPVTMTLHGRQPPVGDHFRPDQTLFPSSLVIGDNKFLHYHVIVWTKLFGQDVTDYGCVYTNGDGLRLCFNTKVSLQKFERWWKRYTRIFFNGDEIMECYAPFPSTGRLTGYFVEDTPNPEFGNIGGGRVLLTGVQGVQGAQGNIGPAGVVINGHNGYGANGHAGPTYVHAKAHETISDTLLPDWVMIIRHSTKRVIRMSNGWFFVSAKDGIMFKMQS